MIPPICRLIAYFGKINDAQELWDEHFTPADKREMWRLEISIYALLAFVALLWTLAIVL